MARPPSVIFKQLTIGPMKNMIYLIGDPNSRQVGVVDPGWDIKYIEKEAQKLNATITCALLTHGHFDHINGVDDLIARHGVKVYVSEKEADYYLPEWKNVIRVKDNDVITIGEIKLECIWTPGHASGGLCYQCGDILLTGDTLFIGGVGRCDLPGGDPAVMYETICHKILPLPDHIQIYPGHAYGSETKSTIGEQKKNNPYLRCKSLDEFLALLSS